MTWLIQRTAPQEPTTYWGKPERWIHRGPKKVPELALRYDSYDVAFEIAEWLRAHQPIAYGEVIAVITNPEPT